MSALTRIVGALAEADAMRGASLGELVRVGPSALLGEVLRVSGETATLQVFEDTTGLALGETGRREGRPLSIELSPGLLGAVIDGVGRPLARLGDFLEPGATSDTLDRARRFQFAPSLEAGAAIGSGDVLGTVLEGPAFEHRILVPPGVHGPLRSLRAGTFSVNDAIGELDDGTVLRLAHRWPVRVPRPARERLSGARPLLTGQRMFDFLLPVAEGGTVAVPGGFGTGKTVIEQSLAKFAEADIVVYIGCGERGNEMAELLHEFATLGDPRTGRFILERTVLVVNTSNMPVAARESSVYIGLTVAGEDLPARAGRSRFPSTRARVDRRLRRRPPSDLIETGISAIDGMNTLVRGQKLPVFSGPGLLALELAATIVENARAPRGEPFAVVFVAIGITERETRTFLDRFTASGARDRGVLYLNRADDPTIERLLAPRAGLACAEYLALEHGLHVLVVMADITHYTEALREVAAAREEVPGRRGYPGYMYTDLASLFERAGVVEGKAGSVTQLLVLTMPEDDIAHPIPDLTGYITEGQVVLSRELHRRGIFPPVDVLPSLSRLMNAGIGAGRTAPEHRKWADQLYAIYARGAEKPVSWSPSSAKRNWHWRIARAIAFADAFERELVGQGAARRTLAETIEVGWKLLDDLPREDLLRLSTEMLDARRKGKTP